MRGRVAMDDLNDLDWPCCWFEHSLYRFCYCHGEDMLAWAGLVENGQDASEFSLHKIT